MIRLSNDRYEQIKKIVADVIEESDISDYAIDLFEIIKEQEIKVFSYQSLSMKQQEVCFQISEEGYSIFVERENYLEWRIYYNEERGEQRVRFTLAHELGHILLDHEEGNEISEHEANFFAKNLLAPPCVIFFMEIEDYIDLANAFNISQEMAYYQMNYYNKWLRYGKTNFTDYENRILKAYWQFCSNTLTA